MPTDSNSLTPEEQSFFETGELPPELAAEYAASQNEVAEPAAPVAAEPAAVVTPPVDDSIEVLRQSLLAEQQARANLQAQLASIEQAKKVSEQPPPPDPESDPLGAMMHQLATVNKTVQDLQAKLYEQHQQREQQSQLQEFQSSMHVLRDEFIKTQPDFQDAYNHLRNARIIDMQSVGIPKDQIQQALLRDEYIIAQNSTQQGKNPAAIIYEMAKRHGYTPTASKVTPESIATKLANIKSGQAAARTVSPASNAPENITMETLKGASDSDLNRLVLDDKAWSKLGGNNLNDIFH